MLQTPQSPTLPKVVQAGFYIFGFALIALGTYRGFQDKTEAATLFIVGVVLFLLANLDKLEHFNVLGFQAKMRTLEEKMTEAQEIVRQLRALAVSTARHIVTLVSCGDGYVETYSKQTAWEMIESVRKNLVELGIDQHEIDDVLAPYRQRIDDYFQTSFSNIVSETRHSVVLLNSGSQEAIRLADTLQQYSNIGTDLGEWRRATTLVSEFKKAVPEDSSTKPEEMVELTDDLEHWQSTRLLRRPEAYFG